MRRIQVITQKELVHPDALKDCTAVAIDVFLATSTIIFLLENNYEPVYAMKDIDSAKTFSSKLTGKHIRFGEIKGEPVEGFIYPDPNLIEKTSEKMPAIICSTNGTKAIESAKSANKLYIASLINGHVVAERLHSIDDGSSIVIICSGNNDRFSMEDFVGAGQIIDHLVKKAKFDLSDSAKMAQNVYHQSRSLQFKDLLTGETASLLRSYHYSQSMELVLENVEKINILPVFSDSKIINEMKVLEME